jgi:two-component system nitrate/nitrite sensor histidine kinase NarX
MHYYLTALAIVAGICFAFGILFLFTGLRRKDDSWLAVLFSLFALSYAAAILTGMANYSATSVDDWLSSARLDGVFVVLTWCLLIGYVAVYTGVKPRIFLALLLAAYVSSGIANVVRPNLIHDEILGLASVTLPWGEQLAYVETTDSIWATVFLVANLVTIGYVLVACTLQFLRGERQPALVLGGGMAWFIMTIIVDILVDLGIAPLYVGDFGFLGLAIALGLQLIHEVIRTEEELTRYRHNLEVMVEDRTEELQDVNADLMRANQQLAQEIDSRMQTEEALRRRVGEMDGLNRIANTLSTVTELSVALEQVCEVVTDLFSAQHAYIISPSAQDAGLQVLVGYARLTGTLGMVPLPIPLTEMQHFSRVLNETESFVLHDLASLPLAAPVQEYVTSQKLQSAMLVPLVVRGQAIGLLAVATDQPDRAFSSSHLRLAETVAADVAGAIENARLFGQAQEVAVAEERSRLARELHDSVTQILFSINLIALSLRRLWKRDPEIAARSTDELQRLTRGALAEMRTLLRELRPQTIAATELSTLLKQLGDGVAARHDIPVGVEVSQLPTIPPEVHVALYRIAQEALNNITKHAEASQVVVKLACDDTAAHLTIADDGQGFDLNDVPAGHMGLDIMRERADAIGAAVTIASRPGAGTSITVDWPLQGTTLNENADSVGATPRGRPSSE